MTTAGDFTKRIAEGGTGIASVYCSVNHDHHACNIIHGDCLAVMQNIEQTIGN